MQSFWFTFRDVLFFAVWLGIPLLVFFSRRNEPLNAGKRLLFSVLATWLGLILYYELIHWRVASALAASRGNESYDGTAVVSAFTLFGWVLGIVSSLPVIGMRWLLDRLQKK